MFCTHGQTSNEKQQLVAIAESLEQVGKRLEVIERFIHITSFLYKDIRSIRSNTFLTVPFSNTNIY